jgi:hypothetical protein
MKTWKQYCENLGGGLPAKEPNYSGARPFNPAHTGTINIGQCLVALVSGTLRIDTAKISMNLKLTPEQIQEITAEFDQLNNN